MFWVCPYIYLSCVGFIVILDLKMHGIFFSHLSKCCLSFIISIIPSVPSEIPTRHMLVFFIISSVPLNLGSIPGLGRSPGEGKGYPLQYSSLKNSMDCIVHGITKSQHDWVTFTFTFWTLFLYMWKACVCMCWFFVCCIVYNFFMVY